MDRKLVKQWVAALRSGKYKQGQGKLRTVAQGEEAPRYCCLGVLCELIKGSDGWKPETNQFTGNTDYRPPHATKGTTGMPSDRMCKELGLNKRHDGIPTSFDDVRSFLADKNDSGWGFKRIANWIEKNL